MVNVVMPNTDLSLAPGANLRASLPALIIGRSWGNCWRAIVQSQQSHAAVRGETPAADSGAPTGIRTQGNTRGCGLAPRCGRPSVASVASFGARSALVGPQSSEILVHWET